MRKGVSVGAMVSVGSSLVFDGVSEGVTEGCIADVDTGKVSGKSTGP